MGIRNNPSGEGGTSMEGNLSIYNGCGAICYRTVMHFLITLTALLFAVSHARAYEFDTYRYELVKSNNDKVCKHMERVYNTYFKRPHDHRGIKRFNGIDLPPPDKDKLRLYRLIYSFWPTSPEFDAVKWEYRTFRHIYAGKDRGERPMIFTDLDIDNDGEKEIVIKSRFYSGLNGFENLTVSRKGEISLRGRLTLTDISRGPNGEHPPSFIGNPAVIRPFIFQGVIYLHMYDYYRPEPGIKGGSFEPPETLWIQKYHGGGRYLPEFIPPVLEDVCEFNMVVIDR